MEHEAPDSIDTRLEECTAEQRQDVRFLMKGLKQHKKVQSAVFGVLEDQLGRMENAIIVRYNGEQVFPTVPSYAQEVLQTFMPEGYVINGIQHPGKSSMHVRFTVSKQEMGYERELIVPCYAKSDTD